MMHRTTTGLTLIIVFFVIMQSAHAQQNMARVSAGVYKPLYKSATDTMEIRVDEFMMDVYPVTNSDYLDFVKANPRWQKTGVKKVFVDETYLAHWTGDTMFSSYLAKSPVIYVSWFAARAYCRNEGKRLPTAAEWEMAAAAGERVKDGSTEPAYNQRLLDWYGKPTPKIMPKVGSTFKNFYGVYDMHGLVWEWVEDFNNVLITGESRGDSEVNRNLFCGGGAVGSSDFKNYSAFLRYGYRGSLKADYTVPNLGFRCAKSIIQ